MAEVLMANSSLARGRAALSLAAARDSSPLLITRRRYTTPSGQAVSIVSAGNHSSRAFPPQSTLGAAAAVCDDGLGKPESGSPPLWVITQGATPAAGRMKLPVTPNRLITSPTAVPSMSTAGAPHS